MPYDRGAWSEEAARLAGELKDAELREVAATMVHPDRVPDGLTPWDWRFRTQVAAALVLGRSHAAERWLYGILDGPVDWTTTAVMVALTDRGLREPSRSREIARCIWALIEHGRGPIWLECVERPGVELLRRLPEVSELIREGADARRQQIALEDAEHQLSSGQGTKR
jgi:hypothetical protein